jgi:hypothetical protein
MRRLVKASAAIAAVGVILVSGLPVEAQKPTPNPDVPELQPLHRFIGAWDQQVVIKISEWAPKGTTMDGVATANWILNGQVIENRVS